MMALNTMNNTYGVDLIQNSVRWLRRRLGLNWDRELQGVYRVYWVLANCLCSGEYTLLNAETPTTRSRCKLEMTVLVLSD